MKVFFAVFLCFVIFSLNGFDIKGAKLASLATPQDSKITESKPQSVDSIESKNTESKSLFPTTYAERYAWKYGSTLLGFFNQNAIPESTYYTLPPEDKELVADVKTDSDIYILRDSNGKLLEAYLPLNADMQVRIMYKDETYKLEIIPILSLPYEERVVAKIDNGGSPSKALYTATQDAGLNQEFLNAYKERHIVQKGDRIATIYTRKYRLGKNIGTPDVKSIAVESNKKFNYIYGYKNRYYDAQGRELASFFLTTPLNFKRISSKFSSGRKHPVLGYVRPHYGVDYAAATGTPVNAAGDGKISFSGVKGGYGNVVEIEHAGGIRTLYAHLSKIGKNAKQGSHVRQGTYIGNVGTTGLSTGPHLHFGVYKNNKPINPLDQIKTLKNELEGKDKEMFLQKVKIESEEINTLIATTDLSNSSFYILKTPLDSIESNEEFNDDTSDLEVK